MKPHIKVIQRNGVDIFVTSSIRYGHTAMEVERMYDSNPALRLFNDKALMNQRLANLAFSSHVTRCNLAKASDWTNLI